jgi:tetratricopeptide (TPR) repeat protein
LTESLEQEISALRSLYGSPKDPEGRAFAPLADAYRRAGDFRQAVEILRQGLDRHPGSVPGHVVAAQLYLEKGLLEEGEIAARRAVELDEGNVVAWSLLAAALESRGALAQARDARARLAELEGMGAPAEPEPVLEVAELAPAEPEPVLDVAELAPDRAEPEPAVDVASLAPDAPEAEPEPEPVLEVAELAPEEPEPEPAVDVALLAPDAAEAEPEPEPVLEVAELAPEDLPSDELPESEPLVTRTMAELYARQGLTERALGVYRQLLQVSPGDPELRRRVAELEGKAGAPAPQPEEEAPERDHTWTAGAGEQAPEVETPFAWTAASEPEEVPPAGPSARSYFERMLAWEPRAGSAGEDLASGDGA